MKRSAALLILITVGVLVGSSVFAQTAETENIPGLIAYIGIDYNIYTWSGLGEDDVQLTTDAELGREIARRYQMPTWSSDGRLAYFATDIRDTDYVSEVFVSADGTTAGQVIYSGDNEVLNYASWSPQNCDSSENCRELAMLFNNRSGGGLFVKVVEDEVLEFPSEVIGRGGPFYFSWNSSGDRMLWQRNNTRLDVYDVESREILERLPLRPGVFQTPHWSPVDDRLLVGILGEDERSTDLMIVTQSESNVIAEELSGIVYFSWSPNGNYVSYTMRNSALVVVDSESGDVQSRTIVDTVGPFFWSPDSSKVAFVTLANSDESFTTQSGLRARATPRLQMPDLVWSVLEIETGEVRRYSAFVPTPEMVYLFTYFDQFAKSHSLWSPDSRYIVYGEISEDNAPVISIVDTSVRDTVPLAVAEGYLGIWSYD
jgi:hypothetical protein